MYKNACDSMDKNGKYELLHALWLKLLKEQKQDAY